MPQFDLLLAAELLVVLLPRRTVAPLLHQVAAAQGYGVEQQPAACQEAEAWIKRARDRRLALPISPELLAPSWLDRRGLQPLADQPLLVEQLWLLLPQGAAYGSAARKAVRALRQQLRFAEPMQDQHETIADRGVIGCNTAGACCARDKNGRGLHSMAVT